MEDQVAKSQAIQSPETLGSVIHAIVLQKYGEEAYAWDPLTVYMELQADFGVDPDSTVMDRWSAISVIMSNNTFFQRPEAFMGICNTLADGSPSFDVFNPVSVEEAAWAITEVSLNRELLPFSYAIKQYLKIVLKQDGYDESNYPDVFKEVFGPRPSAKDIRIGLGPQGNNDLISAYIEEQLRDMTHQFDKINSLKELDDMILRRSMDEYISTVIK